ncbi:MAG: hypothetical protein N2111_09890 [Candidatus Sumerlaeaceae bacterium]|nr:hypothetical protein [Candidatus Sumerlaeaceae bacterium]
MFMRFTQRGPALTVERVRDNPVVAVAPWTWRDREAGTPCLVRIGGRIELLCHGHFGGRDRIGRLTAAVAGFCGTGFAESGSNPVLDTGAGGTADDLRVRYPSVVERAGVMYCFYEGRDERGSSHVCAAVSRDGSRWAKYPRNPLFPGCEPSAIVTDRGFVVLHTRPGAHAGIWAADSADGTEWTVSPAAVFGPGAPGSWDGGRVGSPRIHAEQGVYYLFYAGWREGAEWPEGIGLAMSQDLRRWRRWPGNPLVVRGGSADWDGGGIWPGGALRLEDVLYLPYEGLGFARLTASPPQVGMLVLRGCLPRPVV